MNNKLLKYLVIATLAFLLLMVVGKKAGWFGKEMSVKVSVETPQKRSIIETITANGKVQPETEVKISPDVSGEIIDLVIKEGDFVERGDLLLKIKPDVYISMRDRAEASLNNAKAQLAQVEAQFIQNKLSFERNEKLWQQKTISDAEYESAKANYDMAKANLEAAKYAVKSAEASLKEASENLDKTIIYAPMSGTVSKLSVELGERVLGTVQMQGTEMLRIADLDRMEVVVEVNENDIVRVSMGDTALIEVDAYLGTKFTGIVTEIANSANVSGVSVDQVTNFDVKILILETSYEHLITESNPTPFRPGMSASVDIQTETRHHVLTIPIQAVTSRVDSSLVDSIPGLSDDDLKKIVVFGVVDDERSQMFPVETGIQDDTYIQVIEGISDSLRVVVSPYNAVSKKLENGTKLEIVDKKELFKEEDK